MKKGKIRLRENRGKSALYKQVKGFYYDLISEGGKYSKELQDAENNSQQLWERSLTEAEKQAEVETTSEVSQDSKLKEILGDSKYILYKKFQEPLYKSKFDKKGRELAKNTVSEGGPYFEEYLSYQDQIDSIHGKVRIEALERYNIPKKSSNDNFFYGYFWNSQ